MGRRSVRGVGPKPSSDFDRVLRRHIESASKNHTLSADVDQLVDHLRSAYPHFYSRHKLTPFRSRVSRIVTQISPNPKRLIDDEDLDSYENAPNKKKLRKFDEREEKLRLIENRHVRNGKVLGDKNVTSGGSSSSLVSASDGSDDSSSGEASTSEDAVYGEEYEPEFDLMKSLMRENLLQYGKKKTKQDVELEVVNDKDVKSLGVTDGKKLTLGDDGRSGMGSRSNDGSDDGVHAPKFKDLGGMHNVIEELMIEVIVPLCYPQLPRFLGVKPISGILLHGPPGCGKTKLAHAIANETGLPFYKISATELVSGVSGASEENLRVLFDKAHKTAPSIVFIDEIDAIASKRESLQREMERRIVTQLMTCMDESHRTDKPGYVLVIGATNRADAVDPALRRGGRFDREIHVGAPDESSRAQILSILTKNLKVEGDFDLKKIARSTPGFVGADLAALTNKAGNLAMKRIIDKRKVELSSSKESSDQEHCEDWWRQPWSDNELGSLSITMCDFEEAAKIVQPSLTREGFSVIPKVKWDDVGGLQSLRQEFDRYIVRRIKFPEDYSDFGVDLETGFLLFGPPGCGKTLIAKAVANEAGANFIHVKGPELLNKYVGESEQGVRTMFTRARTCSPCVLFFDEIDALTTKRGKEGGWVVERVLNQLLIELDGAEQRRGVFVIGATNRPEVMDPAILRPGRLGKLMYVPLPSPNERGMILKALSRNKPVDSDVDLMIIACDNACENFSGADLSALVNEAAMAALNDNLILRRDGCDGKDKKSIKSNHFRRALERISPSVSDIQNRYYKNLSQKLLNGRVDSLEASTTSPPTYSYS